MAACNNDAMTNLQNPFRGQQVLTLIGSEQTTSSLVVMIIYLKLFMQKNIMKTEQTLT